jgi:hypothetical protein
VVEEIGPDLKLHEDDQVGTEGVERARDGGSEVERKAEDGGVGSLAVELERAGVAGLGGGGEDEVKVGTSGLKLLDESAGGVDFAEADSVDEDGRVGARAHGKIAGEAGFEGATDFFAGAREEKPDRSTDDGDGGIGDVVGVDQGDLVLHGDGGKRETGGLQMEAAGWGRIYKRD